MRFEISAKKTAYTLLGIVAVLFCGNAMSVITRLYLGHDYVHGLVPLFDFNAESNIPTLYSSAALIFAGVLLAGLGVKARHDRFARTSWFILAAVFAFLAIDETALLHERLAPSEATSGIVPYLIVLSLLVLGLAKFLLALPRRILGLFLASGSVFLLGAVVFEVLGGVYHPESLAFALYSTVEETFEMLGIVLFVFSLLTHMSDGAGVVTVSVVKSDAIRRNEHGERVGELSQPDAADEDEDPSGPVTERQPWAATARNGWETYPRPHSQSWVKR